MKQGKLYTTLVMVLLALGLCAYFGFHLLDTMLNPFSTTIAYRYTVSDSVEVDGMLLREEFLLPEQSGIVESVRREGERVGTGQAVALVHRDSAAQANQALLDDLGNEIDVLLQVLRGEADVLSAAHQDEAILKAVVALRQSTATQSLSGLSDSVVELKSEVLRRDYAYSGTLSQQTLTTRLTQLHSEYTALETLSSAATKTIYAPFSGLYSSNLDGFESVLTPDTMLTLTESDLQRYLSQSPQDMGNMAGKLILGSGWYLALSVPTSAMEDLKIGDKLTVRFGGEFSQDVSMKVTRLGEETEGNRLLILFSDRYTSDTTLLRQTSVELIYGTNTGIRVPKEALRMISTTDKEGVTTQTIGIYTITAGRAEFRPIDISGEGQDFYVVKASDGSREPLREGDRIVVHATDLYDGKHLD